MGKTTETRRELLDKRAKLKREYKAKMAELKQIEQEITNVQVAIDLMEGKQPKSGYDANSKREEKVLYILSQVEEASLKEMAEYAQKHEKDADPTTLYESLQQGVLRLVKKEKLTKIGNYGGKYKLK